MNALAESYLISAWQQLAPMASIENGFPRGFWPDVARLAVEMALAETTTLDLDWRPTYCTTGSYPEARTSRGRPKPRSGKISAAERQANTEALLAQLQGKAPA